MIGWRSCVRRPLVLVWPALGFVLLIMARQPPTDEPGARIATHLHQTPHFTCPSTLKFRDVMQRNPATGSWFPRALLLSSEGSGNTWARILLENSTGMICYQRAACFLCVLGSSEPLRAARAAERRFRVECFAVFVHNPVAMLACLIFSKWLYFFHGCTCRPSHWLDIS